MPHDPVPDDPLPSFLGIGALKAGTTYLDALLRDHPGLSLPLHLKEADYFSRRHDRGPQWYAGLFAPADGRPRGEVSPQYVSHPLAPDRVAAANADVRLLVSLRDPVDRVVSQYRHWVQETGYRKDLATFVVEHPNAVARSRYADDLAPWVARFGRESVHVVAFEDLVADPSATARAAYAFLGVDPGWTPDPGAETNASVAPRFPRTYALAKRVGRRLDESGHATVVARVKRSPVVRALKGGRASPTDLGDGDRDELSVLLEHEAERVSTLLDRDIGATWTSRTS